MLQQSTIDFLKELDANNERDWFQAHKKDYEAARKDFTATVQQVIDGITAFDKELVGLAAKDCLFRIFRDVRFSANKAPYKTNFGANMSPGGRKSMRPGYYIHIEPGNKSFLAGGVYMPPSNELNKVRQEIDYNTKEFKSIINDKNFKKHWGELQGEQLKTAPKNYSKDHPEIELLRFKSYIMVKNMKDGELTKKDFEDKCIESFKVLYPFDQFLRRALD